MFRSRAGAATIVWALAAGPDLAIAQENQETTTPESLLLERNRRSMHPGDPLKIVGIEQGANDIRSQSPALARSDRRATKMDSEELHRRAMAVYERGAPFADPTATLSQPILLEETSAEPLEENAPGLPSRPERQKEIFGWILGSAALAWLFVRLSRFLIGAILARLPVPHSDAPIRVAGRPARRNYRPPVDSASVRAPIPSHSPVPQRRALTWRK